MPYLQSPMPAYMELRASPPTPKATNTEQRADSQSTESVCMESGWPFSKACVANEQWFPEVTDNDDCADASPISYLADECNHCGCSEFDDDRAPCLQDMEFRRSERSLSEFGDLEDDVSFNSSQPIIPRNLGSLIKPREIPEVPGMPKLSGSLYRAVHDGTHSTPIAMTFQGLEALYTEGYGSEDGLDVPECVRDEDYCPSAPKAQGHGSGDDSDNEQHGRKRRKVSPHRLVRSTPTSARSSRREMRSTRAVAHSMGKPDTSAYGALSPTSSQARSVSSEASAFLARFQEWPLENVSMKRITENGKTTFQFQFEWPLCTNHPHATSVSPDSTRSVATKPTTKRAPAKREKYSDDEDNFLIQLKEEEQLRWAEIRRRFAQRFPERGGSGLQVHYCTKLKDRGRT
ncbi:hypothetical protein IL306_004781 [Fusarium sp. DS 682]|nr:hypothetical protein IL306_004781 [Fusarium sp. DS 682]